MSDNKRIVNLRPDPIVERGTPRTNTSQYDRGLTEGENIGDARANAQGWWDATGNFLTNFIGSTAINVGGLATLAYGGIKSKAGFGRFSDLYDNEVSQGLGKLQASLDEATPAYNTQQEDNSGLSWDYLKSAGFWGNVIGKGGSFIAGAYVGGGVTGKAFSALGKGAKAFGVLATDETKVAQFANAIKNNSQVSWLKNNTGISSIKNFTKYQAQVLSGNMYEASVEASGVRKEIIDAKEQEYRDSLKSSMGEAAFTAPIPDLLKQEWEDLADKYGNIAFGMNMALLKIDGLGFNKMLYGYRNTKKAVDLTKNSLKYGELTLKKKLLNKVGKTVGGGLFEGLQEGGQFVVEKGTVERAKQKNDYIYATIKGLEDTFGTKDGQTSMLAGLLLGGLGNVISSAFDEKNVDQKAISLLNKYTATDSFQARVKYLNKILDENGVEKKENSLDFGDKFTYKNQEANDDFNYWQTRVSFDRVSDGVEDLKAFKNTPFETLNDQFKTQFKNENDKNEHFQERINKAEKVEKIHNQIEEVFGNRQDKESLKKLAFLLYDVQERIKSLQPKLQEDVTGKIAEDLNKLQLREREIKELYTTLLENKKTNPKPIPTSSNVPEEEDKPEVASDAKPEDFGFSTTTDNVGNTIELETNKPVLIVGETKDELLVKDDGGNEKEVGHGVVEDVKDEKENYQSDERQETSLTEDAPNKSMVMGNEFLNYTDLGLKDNEQVEKTNKNLDSKLVAENSKLARSVKNLIINSKGKLKDVIKIFIRRDKQGLQVIAKNNQGEERKIGYILDYSRKANNAGGKSIGEFLVNYLNSGINEKKANTLSRIIQAQNKISALKDYETSAEEIDITENTYLRSKIITGVQTNLQEAITSNPERWTVNGQVINMVFSKGQYVPNLTLNKENKKIVIDELSKLDLTKHHSPYIILVKRPDSDRYQWIDAKGSALSKETIDNYVAEYNSKTTAAEVKAFVDQLNKDIFLASKTNYTFKVGPLAGASIPVHLKFVKGKGTKIHVVAEPKLNDKGEVLTIGGEVVKIDKKDQWFANMPFDKALATYGTERFLKEQSFEEILPKLIVNTSPKIWDTIFSFSHLGFLENQPNQIVDPVVSPTPITPVKPQVNSLNPFAIPTQIDNTPKAEDDVYSAKTGIKQELVTLNHKRVTDAIFAMTGFPVTFYKSELNWGEFRDAMIYLNSEVPKGEQWHEAFHAVWSIIPKIEQDRILKIARDKITITQEEVEALALVYLERTGKIPNNLVEILYEEKIADMFKDYMNSQPTTILGNFFSKLKQLIKTLLNISEDDDFKALFVQISNGEYKYKGGIKKSKYSRYSTIKNANAYESKELTEYLLSTYLNREDKELQETLGYTETKINAKSFIKDRLIGLQKQFNEEYLSDVEAYNKSEDKANILPALQLKYSKWFKDGNLTYPQYLVTTTDNLNAITAAVVSKGQLKNIGNEIELNTDDEELGELFNASEMEKSVAVKRASKAVRDTLASMYYIDNGRVKVLDSTGIFNNLLMNLSKVERYQFRDALESLGQHNTPFGKSIKQVFNKYINDNTFKAQVDTAFDVLFVKAFKAVGESKDSRFTILENYKDHHKKQIEDWKKESFNKVTNPSTNLKEALGITVTPDLYLDPQAIPLIEALQSKLIGNKKPAHELFKDTTFSKTLDTLAELNTQYRLDLGDLNFRNAEDKSMYSMMSRSFILNRLERMSLEHKLNWGIFVGSKYGSNKSSYSSMNKKENIYAQIGNYFNNYNGAEQPFFFIQQFEAKSTNIVFEGKKYKSDFKSVKELIDIEIAKQDSFREQELERVKDFPQSKLVEGYHYLKGKNTQELLDLFNENKITREKLPRVYQYFNLPYANGLLSEEVFNKDKWNKFLKQEFNNMDELLSSIDDNYTNITKKFGVNELYPTKESFYQQFLVDQYLNSLIIMSDLLPDQSLFKDYVDLTKRGGGLLASGPSHGSGTFKFGIFKDLNIGDINTTDAQGVEHIAEKLERYIRLGLVSSNRNTKSEKNDKLFLAWKLLDAYVRDDRPLIESIENDDALLKVDKTVGYDEAYYIKTSVIPLTRYTTSIQVPEGTTDASYDVYSEKWYLPIKGQEFSFKLLNKMSESLDSPRVFFADSAIKKGKNSLWNTEDNSEFPGTLEFGYSDYRLQQENPSGKEKIKDGTQLIQLIEAYLPEGVTFNDRTRKDLIDKSDRLIVELKQYGYDWFSNVGETTVTLPDGTEYNPFLEYIKGNLEGTAGNDRIAQFFTIVNGNLQYSPNMPMMRVKFEQLFMSYYNNNIASHKTPGSKATLASSQFYNTIYDKLGNVLTHREFKQLSLKDQNSCTSQKLHWPTDSSQGHAQIVLTEEYLDQLGISIEEWVRLKNSDNVNDQVFFNKIRYVLGYRIPTQAQHSMLPCEIIDFLPRDHGSTAILPPEITAISGADYDVDSLFIHRYGLYKSSEGLKVFGTEEANQEEYSYSIAKNKIVKELLDIWPNELAVEESSNLRQLKMQYLKAIQDKDYTLANRLKDIDIPNSEELLEATIEQNLPELLRAINKSPIYEGQIIPERNFNQLLDNRLAILTSQAGLDLLNTPAKDFLNPLYKEVFAESNAAEKTEGVKYPTYSSFTNRINEWNKVSAGKASIAGSANENKIAAFLEKNKIPLSPINKMILQEMFPEIGFNTDEGMEDSLTLFLDGDGNVAYNKRPDESKFNTLSNNVSITVDVVKDQTLILYDLNDKNISEASMFAALGFGRERMALLLLNPISKLIADKVSIPSGAVDESKPFVKNPQVIRELLDSLPGGLIPITTDDLVEGYNKREYIAKLLEFHHKDWTEDDTRLVSVQQSIGELYYEVSKITDDSYAINSILNANKAFGKDGNGFYKMLDAYDRIRRQDKDGNYTFSFDSNKLLENTIIKEYEPIISNLANKLGEKLLAYNQNFQQALTPLTSLNDSNENSKQLMFKKDIAEKFMEFITVRKLALNSKFKMLDIDTITGKTVVDMYNKHLEAINIHLTGKEMDESKVTKKYPFKRIVIDTFNNMTPENKQLLVDSMDDLMSDGQLVEFRDAIRNHLAAHDNYKYIQGSLSSVMRPEMFASINDIYRNLEGVSNYEELKAFIGGNSDSELAEFAKFYFSDKRNAQNLVALDEKSVSVVTNIKDQKAEVNYIKPVKVKNTIVFTFDTLTNFQFTKHPIAFVQVRTYMVNGEERIAKDVYVKDSISDTQIIYKLIKPIQVKDQYDNKIDVKVRFLQLSFDDNVELLTKNRVLANPTTQVEDNQDNEPEDNNEELNTKPEVKGINISSRSDDWLGKALTNPTYQKYQIEDNAGNLFDLESIYKANASKKTAPQLNPEDALKYDMNLMYKLQVQKFRKYSELIEEINKRGGLDFILNSSHIIGVKNSRWEGQGILSNFIKVLAKSYETVNKEIKQKPNDYTNHSGGAEGSDIQWDIIGKEFNMINNNHYWMNKQTPHGNKKISKADELEGQQKVTIAARQMGRIESTHQVRNELLIRNWSQVKYSDAVFAIGTIINTGSEMNYGKKALIPQVKGGTGYAVQMAINENKPVYVYDQTRQSWFTYTDGKWSKISTPTLTRSFAGIGTREINDAGKQAIRDVYEKTFNQTVKEKPVITQSESFDDSKVEYPKDFPKFGKEATRFSPKQQYDGKLDVVQSQNNSVPLSKDFDKAQKIDNTITPEAWSIMSEEDKKNWFKCNK